MAVTALKSVAWLSGVLVVRDRALYESTPHFYLVRDDEFNRAHSDWLYAVHATERGIKEREV